MTSIRKTQTGSGATAIQVVKYVNRKIVVLKHIGSAHSPDEIEALLEIAEHWITQNTPQSPLFSKSTRRTISLNHSEYTEVIHHFAYSVLSQIAVKIGLTELNNNILLDLAFMRLIEPTSKLRSIKLIQEYFSIRHPERSVYRALPKFKEFKTEAERIAVHCALSVLSSNLNFVLYDVTTLYFETFKADELRVPGFSKDNKSNQPQIVIGLLVTSNGFPLGYEVFRGNTFEGHTMLPVLKKFIKIADKIYVGGALANNFFWASKIDIGKSIVDKKVDIKKFIINPKIILPIDVKRKNGAILDIGPLATKELSVLIKEAKFVLWNGPLGNFETKGFEKGTLAVARMIARSGVKSVVGGGDTIVAVKKIGIRKFSFVSTAGGAMLEFLAHGTLVGIEALNKSK